ncbi:MAG: hypothetical protein EOM10_13655 [Opitutae bacterium]|nr:hypothetical protein [Opitutae bacterium]
MLLPALNQARDRARLTGCLSNMKQLGGYGTMYANDFDDFFVGGLDYKTSVSNSPVIATLGGRYIPMPDTVNVPRLLICPGAAMARRDTGSTTYYTFENYYSMRAAAVSQCAQRWVGRVNVVTPNGGTAFGAATKMVDMARSKRALYSDGFTNTQLAHPRGGRLSLNYAGYDGSASTYRSTGQEKLGSGSLVQLPTPTWGNAAPSSDYLFRMFDVYLHR